MHDNELSELLARARAGSERLGTARAELAFETRMQSIVRETVQETGPAARFQTWLRAVMGLATVAGIIMFLFITGRADVDSSDMFAAFWTDNSTLWDVQLFD